MRGATAFTLALLLAHAPVAAQQADTAAAADTLRRGPTPRGAMLRSVVLPGWGQLAAGSEVRAGVYFAGHAANTFMVVQIQRRIDDARDIERERMAVAEDSIRLEAAGNDSLAAVIADPDSLAAIVARVPRVRSVRSLINARKQQREDWLALGIFWMLASGVDAYVNAHLLDFPGRFVTHRMPNGRVDVGWEVPWPRRP